MTTSLIIAESLLAIDLGTNITRASLFEVVDSQYRYIATGSSPTTAGAPLYDVGECVTRAVLALQEVVGRLLVSDEAQLIMPMGYDGSGFDKLIVTYSCGPDLRIAIAGLLPDVSLQSAQRLASTVNSKIVETIGITDRRRTEVQVDAIIQARPDLVIIAGGTDNGASRSVYKMVELLLLVCKVLPREKNPDIIYAGNQALAEKVKEYLGKYTRVHLAPNIRPSLEQESLKQGMDLMAGVVNHIRIEQIGGLKSLARSCSTDPILTPHAFGTMIKYLSRVYDPKKGVLGVDLGASSITIAAAVAGDLSLKVIPFGVGKPIQTLAQADNLKEVERWLAADIPLSDVRDYLWQKSLYPASIPFTPETLAIEQASARLILRLGMAQMVSQWPHLKRSFEPVIVTGAVLTQASRLATNLLMLLDGLQPVGITTIILDQNGLVSSLGAAARINSILPIQVLESGAFINLGTIVAPLSRARYGTKILRVHVEYEDGGNTRMEIKQGMLVSIPLQPGHNARLHLEVFNGAEIGLSGKQRTAVFKIVGSECGIVIDGRGRPLNLPQDKAKRKELLLNWVGSLGVSDSGT
jgi:hypothetical protein